MDTSAIQSAYLNGVAPVGLNQRTGESAVHKENIALVAIGGNHTTADGEVILADDSYKISDFVTKRSTDSELTSVRRRLVEIGVPVQSASQG